MSTSGPAVTLKLGTRRSLLAWAQSGWVAREVERLNPGVTIERVGIETRGDRMLDVPLQNADGKEFFVAEIDEALRVGKVDLTVHSLKDLSLERPPEFQRAAIPRRENPRDVIVFGGGVDAALRAKRPLKLGTSSPRRQENLPLLLKETLPQFGSAGSESPAFELVDLRGNVNTRLSRLHEPEGSARHLDGVVLAFAGLIRLWEDDTARLELERLLISPGHPRLRWMVLPLRECPTAPGQGALAVECRREDSRTAAILAKLHDSRSAGEVDRERQLLGDWGGGCHQRFGATEVSHPELGELLWIAGRRSNGIRVDELRWPALPVRPKRGAAPWDGGHWRAEAAAGASAMASRKIPGFSGRAVFVSHARALDSLSAEARRSLAMARIWVSGRASWAKLAAQGFWVEGCAEGFGFDFLQKTLGEKVLGLPARDDWTILTHDDAAPGWSRGTVISTYRIEESATPLGLQALKSASHIFWTSGSQFDALRAESAPLAHHACGPGKTAAHLKANGIQPTVFPSAEVWRSWVKG